MLRSEQRKISKFRLSSYNKYKKYPNFVDSTDKKFYGTNKAYVFELSLKTGLINGFIRNALLLFYLSGKKNKK